MEENITELIHWCDENFDVLGRNVDEYENEAVLPLLVRKTIKLMYKTNRLR